LGTPWEHFYEAVYEFIFRELHGNISYFGNFMGTFAITRELLELCCIGLLRFPPSLWEEEESGAWLEVVREVELEVWKKGKGVFGILLLLQKKK
jgi:hypothetical protein